MQGPVDQQDTAQVRLPFTPLMRDRLTVFDGLPGPFS